MTRRRVALWVSVAAAAVLVTWARIEVLEHLRDQGFFLKYVLFADRILSGSVPRERIGDVSPAYLWLVTAMRAVGMGIEAIRNSQVAMLTAAALLCALAAKRLAGWIAAAATAVLILGNRAGLIVGAEIEPEALIFLLAGGAIYAVVQKRWWVAGVLLGLSATARPVAILTLILAAGWALVESRRAAVAMLVAAAAPIALVIGVNGALTGHLFIMAPGSVFYEANNPLTGGASGVYPRIVEDLQNGSKEPDYGHVAYRVIASRATGAHADARLSNRYWSGKAFAFIRTYPLAALRLYAWRALFAVHHYEAYDLVTSKRKSVELARYPAVPFGLAFVLAVVAFTFRRDRRELLPVALFAVSTFAVLVAFNAGSRQRNALLAPMAVLGGIGAAEIVALARRRNERALYAFGGVMIATPLLGIYGAPMHEDAYNWWAELTSSSMRAEAFTAREQGDRARAIELAASASILDVAEPPLVSDPTLARAAMGVAERERSPRRLFDAAVALEKARAWQQAEAILATIDDYRPLRENRAVSSVAYYRARAALHLRAPKMAVDSFLEQADREAPGDPYVLALRAVTVDPEAGVTLDELHDPFTRDFALAAAFADLGDKARVKALLDRLARTVPEWRRVHPVRGVTGPTFAPARPRSG